LKRRKTPKTVFFSTIYEGINNLDDKGYNQNLNKPMQF